MQYLDKAFDVNTGSSRRPTPLLYEHLVKYAKADDKHIRLDKAADLTDINKYLEQQANLYVSNIIQHVIAQLVGQTDLGFATIRSTDEGLLKVYLDDRIITKLEELKTQTVLGAGSNLIGQVQIEGSSQAEAWIALDLNVATDHSIALGQPNEIVYVTSVVFTVAGENRIIFKSGSTAISGAMYFGATGQPMGMVACHGLYPIKMQEGENFIINLSTTANLTGYCVYFRKPA